MSAKKITNKSSSSKSSLNTTLAKRSIAVYPGSFDPITLGHVNIIERISAQFDEVIVLITDAPTKGYMFSKKERMELVQKALRKLKNIIVDSSADLTVNYLKEKKAKIIIRGIRAVSDFEYEMAMANMNKKLAPAIETLLVFASSDTHFISSRGVKEVARYGGNLKGLVPASVVEPLKHKFVKRGGQHAL